MAPRPSQEGSWAVLGPSWRGLGPLLGAFGPLLGALGPYLGGLRARFGSFGGRVGAVLGFDSLIDSSLRFNDAIRRFDSLIRFGSFINSLSTQQLGGSWPLLELLGPLSRFDWFIG